VAVVTLQEETGMPVEKMIHMEIKKEIATKIPLLPELIIILILFLIITEEAIHQVTALQEEEEEEEEIIILPEEEILEMLGMLVRIRN